MQKKFKILIIITAILGCTAVLLGAFGSHVLPDHLGPKSVNAFKTGVHYQFIHTLAIFCTALLYRIYRIRGLFFIGLFFLGGILLFSGSLYILSLKAVLGINIGKWFGFLTPLGGIALAGSWAAIFFTVIKIKT